MAADQSKGDRFTPTVSRDSTERLEDGLEQAPHNGLRMEEAPGFAEPRNEGEEEAVPSGRVAVRKTPTARRDEQ